MRLLRTLAGKSSSWRGILRGNAAATQPAAQSTDAATNVQLDDYRSQIEQLRVRNEQLEHALADANAAHSAAMMDQRRTETALRERLEQSRSAFEVAWSGFTAEPAIEEQLASLDPGNDRARRWLLKT